MNETIPEEVLDALEVVRSGGMTNMLDRNFVLQLIEDDEAEVWLRENKSRYMEALIAMGNKRANP